MGPSHHYRLSGCALTQTTEYETPLYNLIINQESINAFLNKYKNLIKSSLLLIIILVNNELYKTGKFEWMSQKTDEDEHSIEMQLSFLAKVMESKKGRFKVVPIMVGNVSSEKEAMYGQLLSKYFLQPKTLFIMSSDFCHWGIYIFVI